MEAAEVFKNRQPVIPTGPSEHVATIHPLHPREGVFYPDYELPHYTSSVEVGSETFGKPEIHEDYGTAWPVRLSMNDEHGTEYEALYCQSAKPVSDIWVVKDCAWSTQVEGLNTDVARRLMKLGFHVFIKGPEIGSSIPLSESAHNTHEILDYMSALGLMNSSKIAIEGYSRGSMIGFGTNAYAERFGRKIIYSNLTDPCVARPIKPDLETAKKAVTLPADLGLLGIAIAKGLVDGPRGKHIAKTVDFSLDGAVQFYRTGKPLMNGEAGKLADCTPLDMQATIAFFRRCRVNDAGLFRKILADRPGVRFVRPEGGHGGGIDSRIIGNIAVRFGRIADQLREGRSPEELDYRSITYGNRAP